MREWLKPGPFSSSSSGLGTRLGGDILLYKIIHQICVSHESQSIASSTHTEQQSIASSTHTEQQSIASSTHMESQSIASAAHIEQQSIEVHVIFDDPNRYDLSPKTVERERRDKQTTSDLKHIHSKFEDSLPPSSKWTTQLAVHMVQLVQPMLLPGLLQLVRSETA